MQVQTATETELGLLITGLRAIFVADAEDVRRRLQEQLENELRTRYGKCIKEDA